MTSYTDTILPPRDSRGLPRWAIAALVVLALHLGIGLWLILTRHPETPTGVPSDAVMIDLAPVAAAPSQPIAAPPQETVTPPSPVPPVPPQLTTPEPPPPPPQQTVPQPPPVTATPTPPLPPIPQIESVPDIPAMPSDAVIPPPPPKPVAEKLQEQKKLKQEKRVERERRQKQREERRKERAARAATSARASRARSAAGPAPGASRESMSSWASMVQARVNAAKRYPESARARGESGAATLAFTVDAGGRVVSARVISGSGYADLDRETVSMAHRLGHLPPPPNGRVTLRVRVNFSVR